MELKRVLRGILAMFERAILEGTGLGGWKRWFVYLTCIGGALLMIWLPLIALLTTSPLTYTAKWTLILPGAGVGSSINLESIGQAATAVSSPYTSPSLDPKVSYKEIVTSDTVLGTAAEAVGMTVEAFGTPRIKLVDQTTLMYFSISALSPETAHAKAVALIEALQNQLETLRRNETERRTEAAQRYIQTFQDNLEGIQKKLLAYQKESHLISEEQFQELALTIEKMQQERAKHIAQYKNVEGQATQLADMLAVTPELAADLLVLQANPVFGEFVQTYAKSQNKLTEYLGKWGPNHPEVVIAKRHATQARTAMIAQAEALIGYPLKRHAGLIDLLLGEEQAKRQQLLQELIVTDVNRHGMAAEVQSLDNSITEFQNRLTQNIDAAATLSDLLLQHRVAAAVLTTTLAQLDIGKADPFASYPLLQVLEAPKIPRAPDTSKRKFALLGGIVASVCVIIGLTISWKRQALFQKILKNA